MFQRYLYTGLLVVFVQLSMGQTVPLTLAVNSTQPSLPLQKGKNFFTTPIHGGGAVGTAFRLNQDSIHHLIQTAKLGFLYHQYNQTALQLHSEFSYGYQFHSRWKSVIRLGAGYLHSFPQLSQYQRQDDGSYQTKPGTGRPPVMVSSALELRYQLPERWSDNTHVFLTYQFWLQYPFVRQDVPFLPYTTIQLGLQVPLQLSKSTP
jgi:hypothetical protein